MYNYRWPFDQYGNIYDHMIIYIVNKCEKMEKKAHFPQTCIKCGSEWEQIVAFQTYQITTLFLRRCNVQIGQELYDDGEMHEVL